MKCNSTTVFIESSNSITPLPWDGVSVDFSQIEEPTLSILLAAWEDGKNSLEIIPDSIPFTEERQPDWDALRASLLDGDLYFIYQRIRSASFATSPETVLSANNISTALGFITDGILTVKIESAVAEAIGILQSVGYVFSQEEKNAWNTTMTNLNFSNLMRI